MNGAKVLDKSPIQPQAPIQPVAPVSGVNKETGPISGLMPSGIEAQHNISPELKELGVEERTDRPSLTSEHRQIGLDHSGPSVPISSQPSGSVILPMSEGEVANKLKTGQNDDSGRWLARLIQKIIKAMGL